MIPLPDEPFMRAAYFVLGPLRIELDGQPVALDSQQQQALLLRLLIDAGQCVHRDELVDAIWLADPPATCVRSLRVLVGRLRALLEPYRRSKQPWRILQTVPGGYRLVLDGCTLDAHDAASDVLAAERAAVTGDWATALARWDTACERWQGPALAAVRDRPWARAYAARMDDLRLLARERSIEARIRTGDHASALQLVDEVLAAGPVRERLHVLHVWALHAQGRIEDARATHRAAIEELDRLTGIEPGAELRGALVALDAGREPIEAIAPRAAETTCDPGHDPDESGALQLLRAQGRACTIDELIDAATGDCIDEVDLLDELEQLVRAGAVTRRSDDAVRRYAVVHEASRT